MNGKRATVHMMKPLLGDPPASAATLKKQAQASRLAAVQPHKLTGRHIWLGEATQAARAGYSTGKMPTKVSQAIMARNAALYKGLPLGVQQPYEALAAQRARAQEQHIDAAMATLQAELCPHSVDRVH